MNGTTTTSTLSFSPLYTSHAGLYHCVGTLESPPGNISIHTPPIPVNVSCELDYVTSCMCINGVGLPLVPAPEVSLSVPSGPLYQGTSLTLSCNATLPPSVDTNVNVANQWTPNTTDDRVTITPASSLQSPFISTLTINPLATTDTGNFYCVASADSPSEYITSSGKGEPDQNTVTVTGELLP